MKRWVGTFLLFVYLITAPSVPGSAIDSEPAIIADTFPLVVAARSKSKQVYIFKDESEHRPALGRIILTRRGGENAMAFRVIKSYNHGSQFGGSRIRRTYANINELTVTDPLRAIEKVSDYYPPRTAEEIQQDNDDLKELEVDNPALIPDAEPQAADQALDQELNDPGSQALPEGAPPAFDSDLDAPPEAFDDETFNEDAPPESDQDQPPAEILPNQPEEISNARMETAGKIAAFDPDLDKGTSPAPDGFGASESETYLNQMVIEEKRPLDQDDSWMSIQAGIVRNLGFARDEAGAIQTETFEQNGQTFSKPVTTSEYFSGAGLRYGRTLKRNFWITKGPYQDSLTLDTGFFVYKVLNYETDSDAYTVMPIIMNLRYNVHFTEGLGAFVYAGFVKNFVQSAFDGSEEAVSNLSSILPSIGVGSFFRIGPHWYLRTDVGLDMIGAGLVLRF